VNNKEPVSMTQSDECKQPAQPSPELIDLASLDPAGAAEAGAVLALRHPVSGADLGVRIRLRGTDAPSYRALLRRQIDAQMADGTPEPGAAALEQRHVARLAALTVTWENVRYGGVTLVCTEDNARQLYDRQIWIREQVTAFVEDRAHFLPA
jgi:hypothetical protein